MSSEYKDQETAYVEGPSKKQGISKNNGAYIVQQTFTKYRENNPQEECKGSGYYRNCQEKVWANDCDLR